MRFVVDRENKRRHLEVFARIVRLLSTTGCASGCVVERRICNREVVLRVRISAWSTSHQGLLSLPSLRGR